MSKLCPQVLTGAADRTIRLFNPQKATTALPPPNTKAGPAPPGLIQTYAAHGYAVLDLAVAGDNARFASVGGDRQVFLWDVARAATLRRWPGHAARVQAVAFGGAGDSVVASGGFDATVRLWDAKSQSMKPIQILGEARDAVSGVAVRGAELCAGSVDGRVRTYDLRMGLLHVDTLGAPVTGVAPTADGQALLASTLNGAVRLVDTGNGQLLQKYVGHVNRDYRLRAALAFADRTVLCGSEDGDVLAWDLLDGGVVGRIARAHGGKVPSAVAANAGKGRGPGREWASAGGDGTSASTFLRAVLYPIVPGGIAGCISDLIFVPNFVVHISSSAATRAFRHCVQAPPVPSHAFGRWDEHASLTCPARRRRLLAPGNVIVWGLSSAS